MLSWLIWSLLPPFLSPQLLHLCLVLPALISINFSFVCSWGFILGFVSLGSSLVAFINSLMFVTWDFSLAVSVSILCSFFLKDLCPNLHHSWYHTVVKFTPVVEQMMVSVFLNIHRLQDLSL